ncbi:MAG TPA: rhodanese-like domain-containing protein, partial [Propionibacteriaceae bacterium]
YPEPPPPGMVPSCAEGGVLGVLCASIGSVQVTEAIKLLVGIGEPLVGRLQIYDALEMSWRQLKIRKDPGCAICGENPTVTELIDYDAFCGELTDEAADAVAGHTMNVAQLNEWLAEREAGQKDFLLVDVREKVERDINQIPGSVLIPKGDFQTGEALTKMPQDKQVVLYCKTGIRSAEVLAIVHGAGLADAVHVGGGVSAWVSQIDPSQPAY